MTSEQKTGKQKDLFIYLFAQAHTLRTIRQRLDQDSKVPKDNTEWSRKKLHIVYFTIILQPSKTLNV